MKNKNNFPNLNILETLFLKNFGLRYAKYVQSNYNLNIDHGLNKRSAVFRNIVAQTNENTNNFISL